DLGRPIHPPWEPRRIPAASEDAQSPLPELEEVVVHNLSSNRDERCPKADRERVDVYRRSDGAGKGNMGNAWTTPGPPLPRMEYEAGIPPAAARTSPDKVACNAST
ncbi:uncharacterized protein LOC110444995, partial [Mizuhopecten yessoensis]|uniref:uncharacterized protein LOC110444995 n=1 Tax=Mizuhopecten yessoensis TaxID=6573 RepID=UPI000B45D0CD